MGLCAGGCDEEIHFTLADRSRVTFSVLAGQNLLENSLLISSAKKIIVSPNCEVALAKKDLDQLSRKTCLILTNNIVVGIFCHLSRDFNPGDIRKPREMLKYGFMFF